MHLLNSPKQHGEKTLKHYKSYDLICQINLPETGSLQKKSNVKTVNHLPSKNWDRQTEDRWWRFSGRINRPISLKTHTHKERNKWVNHGFIQQIQFAPWLNDQTRVAIGSIIWRTLSYYLDLLLESKLVLRKSI